MLNFSTTEKIMEKKQISSIDEIYNYKAELLVTIKTTNKT
jgi:hypothetical protein